ncbi:acetyl-CoA carboxylase biotin carboxylase subunit family protein [Lentzea sp. NPDC059081]|uniref:ATP-grasp domain-containing protein n=1 Tax=Lentzea sp. NPDC059081 TaxID=3346719 RepID=UPI0036B96BB8
MPNDTRPPRVLVLSGQRTVRMLKERTDYEVVYADEAMTLEQLLLADFPLEVDFDDWNAVAAKVGQVHASKPIDAVVTGVDRLVPLAGRLAESLGLSTGITEEAAHNCNDKAATERLLQQGGVPVPEHRVVRSTTEGIAAAGEIGLPVIVKPRDGTSASGLMYCETPDDVADAVADVLDDGKDSALIEEFMVGAEFGVFASRVNGQTTVMYVVEGDVGPPPKFVKVGAWFPSTLGEEQLAELERLTDAALAAVGLDNWVASLQFWITEAGPKAGEINPRVAGGQGVELIAATSGYEPTLVAVEAALGRRVEPETPRAAAGLYRSIVFSDTGRLRYREEALAGVEGLESPIPPLIELDVKPGDPVVPINHPRGGAFGRVVLVGRNAEELDRDYQRILDKLDLRVESAAAAESQVERAHTSCC